MRSQVNRGANGEADGTDQIILVSGHAWPVWNYYAPDLPPLRLPELEILDVNAVLDFASSAVPLRNALLGKEDVWLIQWQEKVVDPMNIVPLQLNLAGREERVKAPFWQLGLRHYTAVNAEAVLVEPTEISERSVNFGNEVYLLDYTLADNGDLLLFWQIHPDHSDPMPDLHIAGETVTTDGLPVNRLQDRRLASYEYPPFRWRVDQITLGRVFSEDWVGASALPNDYRMRLSVYDAEGDLTGLDVIGPEGQPLGKHITLDLTLPVATEGPDYVNEVTFAQLITDLFAEFDLAAEQAEPGQLVQAEIRWYAEEKPPGDYDLLVRWRLRDSDEIVEQETLSLSNLPTSQWPDDELMRTAHALRPPLGIAPGDYWLEIGVTAPESTFIRVPFRVLRSTHLPAAAHSHPHRAELRRIAASTRHHGADPHGDAAPGPGRPHLCLAGDRPHRRRLQRHPTVARRARPPRRADGPRPARRIVQLAARPSRTTDLLRRRAAAARRLPARHRRLRRQPARPATPSYGTRPRSDRTATGNHLRQLSSRLRLTGSNLCTSPAIC